MSPDVLRYRKDGVDYVDMLLTVVDNVVYEVSVGLRAFDAEVDALYRDAGNVEYKVRAQHSAMEFHNTQRLAYYLLRDWYRVDEREEEERICSCC
jgi:hypothetical protein